MPTKLFSSWKVHKAELSGNSLETGSVGDTVSAGHLIHYSSELPQLYLEIIIKMGHSMENNRSRNLAKVHRDNQSCPTLRRESHFSCLPHLGLSLPILQCLDKPRHTQQAPAQAPAQQASSVALTAFSQTLGNWLYPSE